MVKIQTGKCGLIFVGNIFTALAFWWMPSLSVNRPSFDFWMSRRLDLPVVMSYSAGVSINACWLPIVRSHPPALLVLKGVFACE
jgi:hypothetical protein